MPTSGKSCGSATEKSTPLSAGTYICATLSSSPSRLAALPPSQYCRLCTKARASCARAGVIGMLAAPGVMMQTRALGLGLA